MPQDNLSGNSKFDFDFLKKYILGLVVAILGLNVLFIDIGAIALPQKQKTSSFLPLNFQNSTPNINSLSCPQSCVDLMGQNRTTIPSQPTLALSSQQSSGSGTSSQSATPTPGNSFVKEFFIPMGQGNGNYADWTVIPGMGVTIDPTNFGNVKSIVFEATIRIPNGNQTVNVRLYNATTYQSVPNSDLTLASGTPTLVVSQPITLYPGSNTFQVQLKTQLQYPAYIDESRLHIKTY